MPFTGLLYPLAHKPTQVRKENQIKNELILSSQESEYSFSSKSSDDEEENQDEPPNIPHIICTETLDK